jgi:hypothetical protein
MKGRALVAGGRGKRSNTVAGTLSPMLHVERNFPGLARALILLSVACSGKEEEVAFGCGAYCEDVVACGPSWAEQIHGERRCGQERRRRCLSTLTNAQPTDRQVLARWSKMLRCESRLLQEAY